MAGRVIIRTDSSRRLGAGHLMRCLTLAQELAAAGCTVEFVCRALPGDFTGLAAERGFAVHRLPAPPAEGRDGAFPWADDARATARVAGDGPRPAWLVVDHYRLGHEWEQALRPHVGGIAVIDDLADRRHDCDLLLDQNYHPAGENRYRGLVPAGCRLLLGPAHALLRPQFRSLLGRPPQRDGSIRRLLVFFGGSDPTGETVKTLAALRLWDRPLVAVDVVVGAAHPELRTVEKLCAERPGTSFHCQTDDMAALMAAADLAIGAGGSATWERCAAALPAILLVVAPNQAEVAAAVDEAGAALNLGAADRITAADIAAALATLEKKPAKLRKMAAKARALVGGAAIQERGAMAALIAED
jgi:UDP-2,4-diacetamido-2,4,6-trideoxy-beta-L-altropyranose hydrolase